MAFQSFPIEMQQQKQQTQQQAVTETLSDSEQLVHDLMRQLNISGFCTVGWMPLCNLSFWQSSDKTTQLDELIKKNKLLAAALNQS